MKWWPDSLGSRLLLAFVGAAAAIAALAVGVRHRDAARAAERRSAVPPAAAEPMVGSLPFVVGPAAGRVLLASRLAALAPDVAPVVQVFADGSIALRRAAPLADAPAPGPTPGDAGILLPQPSLRALQPAARAAALDLIGRFAEGRPLTSAQVVVVDVRATAVELERLLAWVP